MAAEPTFERTFGEPEPLSEDILMSLRQAFGAGGDDISRYTMTVGKWVNGMTLGEVNTLLAISAAELNVRNPILFETIIRGYLKMTEDT